MRWGWLLDGCNTQSWLEAKSAARKFSDGAPGIAAFRERLDTWWLLAESPECPLGSLTLRLGLYLFEPMERREALLRHENNFLMSIPWTELLSTHWPVFAFVGTLAAQARDRDARGIVKE